MWAPLCAKSRDTDFGLPNNLSRSCLSSMMILVFASLAAIDILIALGTGIQLFRQHLQNKSIGWTRPKVFHCLIGAANLGFVLYFILTMVAACEGWTCFSTACGFMMIVAPQTLFLTTFLLLLSFWVDLCNQADDNDDEDDDEAYLEYAELPLSRNNPDLEARKPWRSCLPCRRWPVHGRQRCVVVVVLILFLLTMAFALLIWYGMHDYPADAMKLFQIYANFFTLLLLLSGGGLAVYGFWLHTKMSKVKSGSTSAEIGKVTILAVASVVCFSLQALLVVLSDMIDLNTWNVKCGGSPFSASVIFFYYLIGESIPSIVVLWVMRDLPPKSRDGRMNGWAPTQEASIEDALVPDPNYLSQLISSTAGQRCLLLPECCNSDISPS